MPKTFYSFNKISSYNGTYNMVVGGRGIGKSFGRKKKAISDAVNDRGQFILLRRYKPELLLTKETFFADVSHLFPKWDFRVNGYIAQASHISTRGIKKREWKTIGYFIPLSTAQSFKGVSFAHVTTIIYDEFIIEKGNTRYLPNEAKVFNNFYVTVDRFQDRVTVWFLANSVAINNPFFIEYKIEPKKCDDNGFLFLFRNVETGIPFMVCHFPDSKEFENEVYQTAFGKFIMGTEYADFAIGNEFADNGESLVKEKDPKAKYMYTLETKVGAFSLWHNQWSNEYYAAARRTGNEKIFTLVPEKMSDEKTLLMRNDRLMQRLRTAFNHGRMWFDRAPTRNAFMEIFK